MAFRIGIGISKQSQNAYAAGKEAVDQAIAHTGQQPDLFLILASSLFDQAELIKSVHAAAGSTPVVGCSTAGIITNDGVIEHSVAVAGLQADTISFHPVKVEHISANMNDAGKRFAQGLSEVSNPPKLAFMFSDALSGNGTDLVRGILEVMGSGFPLIGGAAGDDMNFQKTYQYFNGEVLNDAVVGFGVTGEVKYAIGADHGWQPIGNPRTVTKAKGTTLHELDGKPAFSIYEDYFGERAADFKKALSLAAVSYPLGMEVAGLEKIMIRVPLSVQDDGSIICGAEVLEGSSIHLMIGTQSSALWAAKDTTKRLTEGLPPMKPSLVFLSDCVARKILYGERGQEEIETIKALTGPDARIFGFYSYGQIAPFLTTSIDIKTCDPGFYEQSISIAILGE